MSEGFQVIQAVYLVSCFLFIYSLVCFSHPTKARRGNTLAALGMLIAVVGTLLHRDILRFEWIVGGMLLGSLIGIPLGLKIPMTKMPERIALSHAFGGLAVALVGVIEYTRHFGFVMEGHLERIPMAATGFEVLFGAITFTGSLMAFGKLQGILPSRPLTFRNQNTLTVGLLFVAALSVLILIVRPVFVTAENADLFFYGMLSCAFFVGILLVLPIGGADMPVVICLLNSYAGLAASASGFALHNNVLIVCGALDGGSGFILAMAMSKAMNRSFANVLFGAFGSQATASATTVAKSGVTVNEATVEEAAEAMKAASSVIMVPGYGMAVAQAQHVLRELALLLEEEGVQVRYAIHPVAGRMPGHMNVLLAEANVPYDQLFDLEQINDDFASTDVVLVVGANDVVNPAAKTSPGSPIYGMPVFNCDQAKAVIALKRSMNPGFAGIENDLFIHPKTMMVFGDAKQTISKMVAAVKSAD